MGANLDKVLRKKHGVRTIEVRKGDEVKVMRGKFRGKLGKVGDVEVKNTRLQIDGLQREKKGGEKLVTWFNPSNLKIISLEGEDSRRFKRNKAKVEEAPKKVEAPKKTQKAKIKPLPHSIPSENKDKIVTKTKTKEAPLGVYPKGTRTSSRPQEKLNKGAKK
jgi:large subunit ribosomal protein L24